ncbi:TetR/AcrR family transcriptional regulator [Mesorhizobium sp. M1E.F.Ca.ET.045.02.1.1]|uniref:TetR/AcrR family transcriptional regulator n=1 Tax=unclassified Mesorhizobium TaxID=325217 RepID=UPI000F75583A|nr:MULTISPECIES: TetR/AcrR family transcriptional regulator [unclassified Mesorhizobium]RWD84295.1 MAG: TetR family transcriptional regulator [Mesorhizobium sp.]AZO24351.1 TetR/AcrR family transcriptional regulator [Mesorhizobium sp. M1E.F.Ca.ET.045.02.1.1]RUW31587.1 TetR family transcriptional regulator [Mesorhizobium sp. M1E.F.Ca.ET.041.01.1.1]RUW70841.1 TetR family transcriptional regulator [Mesorhizobium sp. M1E.F.Ca.ET.063.01.1.1]TKB08318.1 MAG: TetR/AcrR family transcriptional regulator 
MATDTRTRMIEATALLIRRRGYHGTSLNDILSASGAPRGSLYFHFPGGKDQLVIEVTRDSVAKVTERLAADLATEGDPAVAVRRIYQSVARMLEENEFSLGCPVAPVVLDAPNDVPDLVEICRSAFEQWIGLLHQAFVRAGVAERRAQALALLVESSLEGLMVIARATRDRSALAVVADEVVALVEAAVRSGKTKQSAHAADLPP